MAIARRFDARVTGAMTLGIMLCVTCEQTLARPLSGETLKKSIPGSRINLDTPLGSVVPIIYGADGSLEGTAGVVAYFLGSAKDRGKWWIEDSKLCHQWRIWFNGAKKCFRIELTSANRVEWTDRDGDKGTGTIIALGGFASKPQSVASAVEAYDRPAKLAAEVESSASLVPVPRPVLVRQGARSTESEPKKQRVSISDEETVKLKAPSKAHAGKLPFEKNEPVAWRSNSARQFGHASTFRVVNVPEGDVLNVRDGPSAETEIVATIPRLARGISVTGDCRKDWCPVHTGTRAGWLHRYFISPEQMGQIASQPEQTTDARRAITYRVVGVATNDVLNVRLQADSDSEIVGSIPANGNKIRMTGFCAGDWCPVSHGQRNGWVNRQFLALEF